MTQKSNQTLASTYATRTEAFEILTGERKGNKFDASKAFAESANWLHANKDGLNLFSLQQNVKDIRRETQEILKERGSSTRIRHYIQPVAQQFNIQPA